MMTNIVAILAFAGAAIFFLSPRLRARSSWRATVTPLASIIGSGFLVSLPLLSEIAGSHAILVMAALIAVSYAIGGAIRFNIAHGEKLFDAGKSAGSVRAGADFPLALAFAYFISVTYYLSLLAAFLLKGIGAADPWRRNSSPRRRSPSSASMAFGAGCVGSKRWKNTRSG